jgi:hypothetical protein
MKITPQPGRRADADPGDEVQPPDDAAIRDVVVRLARPHPSGGHVVERAAILAAGAGAADVVDWIIGHDGQGESASAGRTGGLHGGRLAGTGVSEGPALRYILPADALD